MKYPYCVVDGVEYQLEMVNNVLRFPNTKKPCGDLNKFIMSYFNGHIDLQEVWEEYTQTGSSYDLVEGYFSPYGINNHTVTLGNGKCKNFTLHSGDPEVDEQWNVSPNDNLFYQAEVILDNLNDKFRDYSKDEILEELKKCESLILEYKEE